VSQLTRRSFASTIAVSLGATRLCAIAPRPKLCILLIAEQFCSGYLSRFGHLFGSGGLRRLMEEGSYFPDCRMNASSFSSAGLATIATGAYPREHGIVAESWFDAESGKIVKASAAATQAGTLADEIVKDDSRNRVFAIAEDIPRAALLVQGAHTRAPHTLLALLQPRSGEPDWVNGFRQSHSPDRFKNAKWQALQAPAGAPPLRTLTDDPGHPEEFTALYNSSPFAQETQFDFLRAAIAEERLGQGPAFDFVAVALSSMALLGYEVGADSPLMREMALHLDRQIESTLDTLRKQLGAGNFSVVFTAAHGAPDRDAKHVDGGSVARAVDQALSSAYDVSAVKSRYVTRYVYPCLYLNHVRLRRIDADPRGARRAAGEAALLHAPGVAAYYTRDGECSTSGEWLRRFQNSFHPLRSGDLMLAYEPNAVEKYGEGSGLSYGSLYNYDIQTPLLLYGPQFRARTVEAPVESVDIAPTLARACLVDAPSSSSGRVLGEALEPDSKGEK
jgi:predicted AlkP superfamily pyrophosphatase or phosphodiesterase